MIDHSFDIDAWIRPEIRQLSAYHVPPLKNIQVKLDAMENPYQWDKALIEEWLQVLKTVAINRYPDAAATQLKQQLRQVMQIPKGMEIVLGNGSDELIQMLALTFNNSSAPIMLAPEPTFVMYRMIAKIVGMQYIGVPLEEMDFGLDIFGMLEAIDTYQPALTFIAYPNNPTGNVFPVADMEAVLENTSGIVVIDEAYAPFAQRTFMPALGHYPNLLIMRTVSKLGLAGLRLGVLAGPPDLLAEVEKTRLPYNINALSQASAVFALQHYAVLEAQTQQIKKDRTLLLNELQSLEQLEVWPSAANFILFRVKDALEVFNQLKERGILIKCLHGNHPMLNNCLRVTVGKHSENQEFLKNLKEVV